MIKSVILQEYHTQMKADLVELVGETDLWFKYLMVQERGVLKL